jgi:hypothetical protein
VFGGTQDEEFAGATKAFFERVEQGKFVLLISECFVENITGK